DVVAVEPIGMLSTLEQDPLERDCDRRFAARREARHPHRQTLLSEMRLTLRTRHVALVPGYVARLPHRHPNLLLIASIRHPTTAVSPSEVAPAASKHRDRREQRRRRRPRFAADSHSGRTGRCAPDRGYRRFG